MARSTASRRSSCMRPPWHSWFRSANATRGADESPVHTGWMPFAEVAHDVWVARYPWFDVNVSLVRGSEGLLVVDAHASALAAREVVEDVRRLGAGEVV